MGNREDDDYWNDKYDGDPNCDTHGEDEMYLDYMGGGGYYCLACQREDEIMRTYTYG